MNGPLVSVIIPCYNVSSYIERAVRSILEQSYTNLEIWIIDDASTDDTLQKIRQFNDQRIRVEAFTTNTKKVGAVNEVLQKTTGDLICFQDADDWSEKERIAEQVKEFQKDPGLGICFTGYRYAGEKTGSPGRIALSNEELKDEFLSFGHKVNTGFTATSCNTMMITRKALQNTHGYNAYFAGRVGEDIQWVYRILKDLRGITIPQVLCNYSIRQGSLTQLQHEGKNARFAYSWELLELIIEKDIKEHTDVLDPKNSEMLKTLELEACSMALLRNIRKMNDMQRTYESSTNFRLGKMILSPFRFFMKRRSK